MHIRWRGLELPSVVVCDVSTRTATYGKFVAEPFERGFGSTIGNGLRRILLSSLEGSAVTQIKVHNAQHEFTTITGVIEDVTDIVLNVKSLVVKNHSNQTRVLRVDESVEIINRDHVLATLTEDVPFMMEMVVENGRGYVAAIEHSEDIQEIGIIPVDAVYSPVVRVRYEVEETRVGQKTNYDKLTIEIWTDGSIGPEMALVESTKILRKHLNPFVQYSQLGSQVRSAGQPVTGSSIDPSVEAKLNLPIAELHLSVRASNCLESENIMFIRDLVVHNPDDLLEVRNFGETTLTEIQAKLLELGLHLGMRISAPTSV